MKMVKKMSIVKKSIMKIQTDSTDYGEEVKYKYNGTNVEVFDIVAHTDGKIYAFSCDVHGGNKITYFIYQIQNNSTMCLIVQFSDWSYDSYARLYSNENYLFATSKK